MKVGLIGFGATGKAVASILLKSTDVCLEWVLRQSTEFETERAGDHLGIKNEEPGRIYSSQNIEINDLLDQAPVDAIIDFSSPDGIRWYGEAASLRGITLISAISRYPSDVLDYLKILSRRTRIIHSPNITLGVNFLLVASKILKSIAPLSDVAIIEQHFSAKKEISGTAKVLANNLGVDEGEIKSIRAGGIVGVHEVMFGFPHQTLYLKHETISREAFGNGILFALANLPRRAFGLFSMEEILLPYFQKQIRTSASNYSLKSKQIKPWGSQEYLDLYRPKLIHDI